MSPIAVETYIVAFDIQQAGAGYNLGLTEKLGEKEEVTISGAAEFEGKNAVSGTNGTKSGLFAHQGMNVASCKLVELKAGSAKEAVEVVRQKYAQNAGGERTVVKPNETNFQVVV